MQLTLRLVYHVDSIEQIKKICHIPFHGHCTATPARLLVFILFYSFVLPREMQRIHELLCTFTLFNFHLSHVYMVLAVYLQSVPDDAVDRRKLGQSHHNFIKVLLGHIRISL